MKIKTLIIGAVICLSGCASTIMQVPKFPSIPPELAVQCADLKVMPADTTQLSDVVQTVAANYALYHECNAKVSAWALWYADQQAIFEKLK